MNLFPPTLYLNLRALADAEGESRITITKDIKDT